VNDRKKRSRRLAIIGTVLAVSLLVFILALPLLSGLAAPMVPNSVQEPVGAKMVEITAGQAQFCRDEKGLAALKHLAEELAAADESDVDYKIYVSSAEVVNAFAAPGGHIVLFRPIIDKADSPNEVAGVLAHEMGHVVEHHPAQGLVEAVGYGLFTLLVPGAGQDSAMLAHKLMSNKYSQGDELEADEVGVNMLNRAGIDSNGVVAFFKKLEAISGSTPSALEFLSTHPAEGRRIEALQNAIKAGRPALDDEQWAALRQVCQSTGAPQAISIGG
jgi:beta-barrel assembly-enhancing protease